MRKILLSIYIALSVFSIYAQRQCASMDYYAQSILEDPSILQRQQEIEEFTDNYVQSSNKASTVITIPVVVHVVWNTAAQNISQAQIQSQIDVLNQDFRKLNPDVSNVPSMFAPLAADAEIQFCLAQRDPQGNATTGIIRVQTSVTQFGSNDAVKYTSQGGSNAWPRDQYLNLWVCNLGSGLLGYAQFPGGAAATDGVVCNYWAFGNTGVVQSPFHKGRTATHEIGHWLNLRHIWGDANCGNDQVADTPTQQTSNGGCPSHPHVTCGNSGDMWMNYMDYTDDACMYMFSAGQAARMQAALAGPRAPLTTSNGCLPPSGGGGGSCSAPAGLNATPTATSASLTWSAVSGANSCNLQWKPTAGSTWTTVSSVTSPYTLSGLTASTSYQFQVQAVCTSGSSAYSSPFGFTTTASGGGSSCGTPINLAAVPACNSASISWDAVSGATAYTLQYKLASSTSWTSVPNPTSPYNLTNLTASTSYNYRVRATCGNNIGSYSTTANLTTTACSGGGSCGTPTNLSSSNITASSATLSWAAVVGASSYNLDYKATTASSWTSLTNVTSPYNLTGLTASASYNYRVQAVCGANSGTWSTVAAFTTTASGGGGSCGVPTGVSAIPSGSSAAITWTLVSGANAYNIQYRTVGGTSWTAVNSITSSPYVLTGLTASTCYEYQIRAICGNNIGAWSSSFTFCTSSVSCGVPTNVSSLGITSNSATVTWDVVSGANSYTVQYRQVGGTTWNTQPAVTVPSDNITGLSSSTTYEFKVKATCSGVDGAFSPTSSFTTLAGASGCGMPTGLLATPSSTSVVITCTSVSGATAYVVQHRPVGTSSWNTIMQSASLLNLTINNLTPATTYEYQVYAICTNILSSPNYSIFITTGTGGGGNTCNDTYEPNNSSSAAAAITVNQDINGAINPMGDRDWFSFQNTPNQPNIQVVLDNLVSDYDLIVYRPSGGYVASLNWNSAPESVVINGGTVGTYIVRVYGYNGANGPACYRLRANISNTPFRLSGQGIGVTAAYPNPTTGILNIPMAKYRELEEDVTVTVMDQMGRTLFHQYVKRDAMKDDLELNLSELPSAVYNLVLTAGENNRTERIIIAK